MKLIIVLLLLNLSSSKECVRNQNTSVEDSIYKRVWNDFKKTVERKKMEQILFFFTDSLKQNFDSYEENNLQDFIKKKWFYDPYFIKALMKPIFSSKSKSKSYFTVTVNVKYPKAKNDEGDSNMVYFFSFKRMNNGVYKLSNIIIAG